MADDIVRGMEPGKLFDLIVLPLVVVQLYGTLVLAGRRSGYITLLVVSLLELVVPDVHMKGAGVGAAVASSNGAFFFIWTLLALGVTALFSVVLPVRGLWERTPHDSLRGAFGFRGAPGPDDRFTTRHTTGQTDDTTDRPVLPSCSARLRYWSQRLCVWFASFFCCLFSP
jgi:hypothetical protein